MAELVGGAFLGGVVGEIISLAKRAKRCKEDCKHLAATLEHLEQVLANVEEHFDCGNSTFRTWFEGVSTLLVEARGILGHCGVEKCGLDLKYVKTSRFSTKYLARHYLSSKLQDINRRIWERISLDGDLVTIDLLLGLTAASCMRPPPFQMQHVPSHIAVLRNNPFEELKKLILSTLNVDARSIGVKGRGGVGKTLLAKMVNNDEDIRKKYGSILWFTIGCDVSVSTVYKRMGKFLDNCGVFERDINGGSLEEQLTYLTQEFKSKRVLVILDDVWGKLEKNRTMIEWLDIFKGDGSTTLITTRENEVLDGAKVMKVFEVGLLSKEESWKLFSFHAFQPNMPPLGEVEAIAIKVCMECKGLPLALKVLGGALLNEKDEVRWKIALSRLKKFEVLANSASSEDELFHRLKLSYDDLDEDSKKCFLYFAAFPEDYRIPTHELCSIWQAEKLFGPQDDEDSSSIGMMYLFSLADQSLIDLDEDGKYAKIHDILRDLAIRIIQDAKIGDWAYECHFEPGKVLDILPNIKVTTKRVSFVDTHIQKLNTKGSITSRNSVQVCLLSGVEFEDGKVSPCWDMLLCMTGLLYLDLSNSPLEELPESMKELKSLTHLHLSSCTSLEKLPESIKELKSLTHFDLSNCWSLKELPEGIKELKSLTHLDLTWCESLKELPQSIKELKSLSHLDLTWCKSLKELPEGIKVLKSLTHLDLHGCLSLKELPESIKELKSLIHLDLSRCEYLMKLPESIKELGSLTHLYLKGCRFLKELPKNIKELKSLIHFDLSGCKSLKELPESLKELKSLTHLHLSSCMSLEKLPESIKELKSLTHLDLKECKSLKELPESIKELKSLTYLDLSNCWSLKELPESIKELKSLTYLDLSNCWSLKELPESIKELKTLIHLDLSWCSSLKELPQSIKELKSLTHLDLRWCSSLKELPESIKELKSLTHLDLRGCSSLKEIPEIIYELKSHTHLDLSWCTSLKEIRESIKELKSLTQLDLTGCSSLKELPESIKELKSLTHLDLRFCESLKELPENIKELKSLTYLDLSGCKSLKELSESIKELKSLSHLDLRGCETLKELPESIKELKSLTHLDLRGCESLKELPENIKELESLRLEN